MSVFRLESTGYGMCVSGNPGRRPFMPRKYSISTVFPEVSASFGLSWPFCASHRSLVCVGAIATLVLALFFQTLQMRPSSSRTSFSISSITLASVSALSPPMHASLLCDSAQQVASALRLAQITPCFQTNRPPLRSQLFQTLPVTQPSPLQTALLVALLLAYPSSAAKVGQRPGQALPRRVLSSDGPSCKVRADVSSSPWPDNGPGQQ